MNFVKQDNSKRWKNIDGKVLTQCQTDSPVRLVVLDAFLIGTYSNLQIPESFILFINMSQVEKEVLSNI